MDFMGQGSDNSVVASGVHVSGGAWMSSKDCNVTIQPFDNESQFPLVIEARLSGLNAGRWAAENVQLVESLIRKHAAILFRNFGLETAKDFETFAEALEPKLYGSYGDLPKKEGGKNTYRSTPYPEKEMILFHNESSHLNEWPRKQWLLSTPSIFVPT